MPILYKNWAGYSITRHSYSAGQDFHTCPRLYKLKKIDGWREKDHKASMELGNAVEAAVQYYHTQGLPGSGVDEFKRLWLQQKDAELTYGERDGDWTDFYRTGSELLALYEVVWPTFGYTLPAPAKDCFQRSYRKEVFPGSRLAGLEDVAYVDMLAEYTPPTKISGPNNFTAYYCRPVIIDIKTSSAEGPATSGLLQLDPQLRRYAWITGIPDVGFLWFGRTRPTGFKRGDAVTLLTTVRKVNAGGQGVVLVAPKTSMEAICLTVEDYATFEKEAEGLKNKALDDMIDRFKERGFSIPLDELTKQSVSFVRTRISEEGRRDTGDLVGQEIERIVAANERGRWPQTPGIRWPHNPCMSCPCLGICSNNPKLVEEKLVRATTKSVPEASKQTDWAEEI